LPAPEVLLIEDERKTRDSVVEGLRLEGWRVSGAGTAERGWEMLAGTSFDLVVLDRMLPDGDGLELLQRLRQRGQPTPVLVLTARGDLDERVRALEGGADDYLTKPFAFAELVARCRALLRRPVLAIGTFLRCEDLHFDLHTRLVSRGSDPISLTPRECEIIEYLLRYQGQVVTREMLERDVWKQAHRFTSLDNVIDVQMMRLRRKIDGEGRPRLLHTLRGVGYRLGREADA
jgi:two-component system copper resistance phosphate regulon response regulator CusR